MESYSGANDSENIFPSSENKVIVPKMEENREKESEVLSWQLMWIRAKENQVKLVFAIKQESQFLVVLWNLFDEHKRVGRTMVLT
jgi:hypothetical protein